MPLYDAIQDMAWALRPSKLDEVNAFIAARLNEEEIAAALKAPGPSGNRSNDAYQVVDGVAVIPVYGVISKRMNMMQAMSGGTSSEMLKRDIAAALADRTVAAILLDVESPGGSVDGTKELADFIHASRGPKPIVAYANGLMASAAYWIGSAADIVVANDTAIVGSIGVAMTHYDRSEADAKAGVKATEIYAGKYKRIATGTAPLSQAGREYLQSMVDTYYTLFVEGVAKNRNVTVEKALEMADGKEFIGNQAREAGLVDVIGTKDRALGIARERGNKHVDIKTLQEKHPDVFAQVKALGVEESKAEAIKAGVEQERARVAEIMAADGDQAVTAECIKNGTDVTASLKLLFKAEREGREKRLAELRAKAPTSVGQEPPATGSAPKETFESMVDAKVKAGASRSAAIKAVVASHPKLHEEYLARVNAS